MGNTVGAQPKWNPQASGEYLTDLRDTEDGLLARRQLWSGRFMKTLECVCEPGNEAIVKVYLKRDSRQEHSELSKVLHNTNDARRCLLAHDDGGQLMLSHVWPFQRVIDGPRAVYLIRQKAQHTLASRIGSRPFPTAGEKRWLAFQLLHAVHQAHSRGVVHGDIKAENCALTSWSWLLLTDFATYKPAFLPRDNPSEFSFFFDTGGRRRCYIAPERFHTSDSYVWSNFSPEDAQQQSAADVANSPTEASRGLRMERSTFAADIFSAGCVIAELFSDGVAPFDLSSLLSYAACGPESDLDKQGVLDHIDDRDCRALVRSMITLDPSQRPSAQECLQSQLGRLFPHYFETCLHPLLGNMLDMSPNARISSFLTQHEQICSIICAEENRSNRVDTKSTLAMPTGNWQCFAKFSYDDSCSIMEVPTSDETLQHDARTYESMRLLVCCCFFFRIKGCFPFCTLMC